MLISSRYWTPAWADTRTCMNVIVGRRPRLDGADGFVLDKFSLYYPDNNIALAHKWGNEWPLLQGYSFRTAVLNGTLNRGDLRGLQSGRIPVAPGTSFDRKDFGLIVDGPSAYEDCAYVKALTGESDKERWRRIEGMVVAMDAAYGGSTLALSYDPAESAQGVTALRSEWELLKKQLGALEEAQQHAPPADEPLDVSEPPPLKTGLSANLSEATIGEPESTPEQASCEQPAHKRSRV